MVTVRNITVKWLYKEKTGVTNRYLGVAGSIRGRSTLIGANDTLFFCAQGLPDFVYILPGYRDG